MKPFSVNKKVRYDYEILQEYEAGLVLLGHEVKAVRTGLMSLRGAYVKIKAK